MSASTPVVIHVQTSGTGQAESQFKSLARTVWSTGNAVSGLAGSFRLGTAASAAFGYGIYQLGGGLVDLGKTAALSGLQFDASMEQNQVAFSQFLGSAGAARTELRWLTREAAVTPFQLPQITMAARRLLAYNMGLKGTNAWLQTIADTTAGAGLGADAIDRLVTVLGQIKGKGFLQGDEMQQLGELGVLNRDKLAKDLNITPLMLSSGNARIPADKALRAIKHQLDAAFGGQSAKQARTFNGQLSNIQDNLNKTLGTVARPGFEYLRKRVFPAANDATQQINKIFDRTDLDTAQKIRMSRRVLDEKLGPFADALGDQVHAAHLPELIGTEFGRAIPFIADQMGRAAGPAAGAFLTAWLHSGPWGQFLSVAMLAKKTGAFGTLGRALGGKGAASAATSLFSRGATPADPLFVMDVSQYGVPINGGPAKKAESWLKRLGPAAAAFAGSTAVRASGAIGAFVYGSGLAGGRFGSSAGMSPDSERALLEQARRDGKAGVGSTMRAAHPTPTRGGDLYAVLKVDGSEMARVVIRDVAHNAARRRTR